MRVGFNKQTGINEYSFHDGGHVIEVKIHINFKRVVRIPDVAKIKRI
jgi:acyl-CoA thioesterase FadM